mmetsp:Transcript_9082/g.27192  ORF Transcript_9082/g.27192 Transcript_9082/m.27192 type:complete len:253 (+) Transcript_9082:550-1308(+)
MVAAVAALGTGERLLCACALRLPSGAVRGWAERRQVESRRGGHRRRARQARGPRREQQPTQTQGMPVRACPRPAVPWHEGVQQSCSPRCIHEARTGGYRLHPSPATPSVRKRRGLHVQGRLHRQAARPEAARLRGPRRPRVGRPPKRRGAGPGAERNVPLRPAAMSHARSAHRLLPTRRLRTARVKGMVGGVRDPLGPQSQPPIGGARMPQPRPVRGEHVGPARSHRLGGAHPGAAAVSRCRPGPLHPVGRR